MDSFNRRIDSEDSFDVGEDSLNSFDMTSSSSSFTIPSPDDLQSTDGSNMDSAEQSDASRQKRRPLYEAPDFIRRLNVFEEVDVGGTVTFECQVRAFPRPTVRWYKDDAEVVCSSNTADETTMRIRSEDLTGVDSLTEGLLRLVICDAQKEDEGAYRCKAENEEGVAATTGYLSVTGPATGLSPQPSPRSNSSSTPPLLRAIIEQQSMEDKEAALYVVRRDDDEDPVLTSDDDDDRALETVPDLSSIGDYSMYAEYLKEAIDADEGVSLQIGGGANQQGSINSTSTPDDFADVRKIVEMEASSTTVATAACSPSSTNDAISTLSGMAPTSPGDATDKAGNESANDAAVDDAVGASMVNVVVLEYDYPEISTVTTVIGATDSSTKTDAEVETQKRHDDVSNEMESALMEFVSSSPEHSVTVIEDKPIGEPKSLSAAIGNGDSLHETDHRSLIIDAQPDQTNDELISKVIDDVLPVVGATSTPETSGSEFTFEQVVDDTKSANVDLPNVTEKQIDVDETFEPSVDDFGVRKDVPSSGRSLFSFTSLFQESLKTKPASVSAVEKDTSDLQENSAAPHDAEEGTSKSAYDFVPSDETTNYLDADEITSSFGEPDDPSTTVELTWSTFFEWYLGWFQMPWFVYWLVAVLFTFASTLGMVDPVWVVLTVMAASMLLFRLFPLPLKQSIRKLSPNKN